MTDLDKDSPFRHPRIVRGYPFDPDEQRELERVSAEYERRSRAEHAEGTRKSRTQTRPG